MRMVTLSERKARNALNSETWTTSAQGPAQVAAAAGVYADGGAGGTGQMCHLSAQEMQALTGHHAAGTAAAVAAADRGTEKVDRAV